MNDLVFDNCDLSGVVFWSCGLHRTSFKGADLTGAVIDECSIEGADFTDAVIAGLRGETRLSPRQLQSTRSYKTKDLHGCLAITAVEHKSPQAKPVFDFRGANLEGARLSYGDFTASDFTDARIDRAELSCTMTCKQLASTKSFKDRALRHVVFALRIDEGPDFSGIDLTGAKLAVQRGRHIRVQDAVISEATLVGTTIAKEGLYSTKSYQQGNLSGIMFDRVDMSGWDFSRQNLTNCRFWGCTLTGAKFDDAVITGCYVATAGNQYPLNLTVEQLESTWNHKHGRMEGILLPKDIAAALAKKGRK